MTNHEMPHAWNAQLDDVFRESIYGGTVFRLPVTAAANGLVEHCRVRIIETFGEDFLTASSEWNEDVFFESAGALRREFYNSHECREAIAELLGKVGCPADEHVCDPVRLRVIRPGGHHVRAAAPVYYGHRDTWYSNPQTQITWWLPLHPVRPDQTFEFLPGCFDRAVPNDSEGFDYGRWTSGGTELKVGWQDREAGKRELYPRLTQELPQERRVGFSGLPGECIVFSGQHLHQTVPIEKGPLQHRKEIVATSRFSIDFRTVHRVDQTAERGPANVDNRSTGDALQGHMAVVASLDTNEKQ